MPEPAAEPETDPGDQRTHLTPAEPSYAGRSQVAQFVPHRDLNDRLLLDLIDAVKGILRKETADRLRDVYLIGDIEKDVAKGVKIGRASCRERV